MFLFTLTAMADECASNISQLKMLVGNRGLSTDWIENAERPVRLRFKDAKKGLIVLISDSKGQIAEMTTEVCRKGDNYIANVKAVTWGPAAPSALKNRSVSSMKIKLPYQSVMKVSISLMTFEFSPSK
jgi:hypothetical protein